MILFCGRGPVPHVGWDYKGPRFRFPLIGEAASYLQGAGLCAVPAPWTCALVASRDAHHRPSPLSGCHLQRERKEKKKKKEM